VLFRSFSVEGEAFFHLDAARGQGSCLHRQEANADRVNFAAQNSWCAEKSRADTGCGQTLQSGSAMDRHGEVPPVRVEPHLLAAPFVNWHHC